MIRPLTIRECDAQLIRTHDNFLRAERLVDLETATRLYTELDELLDIRNHLPQPRTTPEDRGAACTDSPSPKPASPPS